MNEILDTKTPASTQVAVTNTLAGLPWWLLIILLTGIFMVYSFYTDETYQAIFDFLKSGIIVTIRVTIIAYAFAITLGLLTGLARVSKNPVLYNLATVYVQVMRGLPILVTILYVAFVFIPAIILLINNLASGWLALVCWDRITCWPCWAAGRPDLW